MNLLPKLVISIATTFMIATVSLEIFAISNNNNDYILTTPTPTPKKYLSYRHNSLLTIIVINLLLIIQLPLIIPTPPNQLLK